MISTTCDEIRDLAPAYVLGALDPAEARIVAEHLRTCSDAHLEVVELGAVVPYLDEAVPLVEPPASLRDRILSAAANDLAMRQAGSSGATASTSAPTVVRARSAQGTSHADPTVVDIPTITPAAPRNGGERQGAAPTASVPGRVVSLDAAQGRRRDMRTWAFGIAAAFAIVALGAWNVITQQELSAVRLNQARLSAALAQAGQPGSQVAVLASTGSPGSGPGGIAVLPASGNGTLVMSGLSPTAGTQVYEAWAMAEGRPPAPIAGFTVGPDGFGYVNKMPSATGETLTVAITLEPGPNPTAPSSPPLAEGVAAPGSALAQAL